MRIEASLRNAVAADAACLSVLAASVWLSTYATDGVRSDIAQFILAEFSPEQFVSKIDDPARHLIVAQHNGHLLGYAHINTSSSCPSTEKYHAELVSLYVLHGFTGKSIGSQLLRESERIAGLAGEKIWLSVNATNGPAIEFYSGHGYRNVGSVYFHLGADRYRNHVFVQESA